MNFLLRFLLCSALGFFLIRYLPGGQPGDEGGMLLTAVVLALFDSFVRPAPFTRRYRVTGYTLLILMGAMNILLIRICDRFVLGFDLAGWGRVVVTGVAVAGLSLLIDRFVKAE